MIGAACVDTYRCLQRQSQNIYGSLQPVSGCAGSIYTFLHLFQSTAVTYSIQPASISLHITTYPSAATSSAAVCLQVSDAYNVAHSKTCTCGRTVGGMILNSLPSSPPSADRPGQQHDRRPSPLHDGPRIRVSNGPR